MSASHKPAFRKKWAATAVPSAALPHQVNGGLLRLATLAAAVDHRFTQELGINHYANI
jgi:hypothetical protein